jgi:hypothetical protein
VRISFSWDIGWWGGDRVSGARSMKLHPIRGRDYVIAFCEDWRCTSAAVQVSRGSASLVALVAIALSGGGAGCRSLRALIGRTL